jgi:hypothetical protein
MEDEESIYKKISGKENIYNLLTNLDNKIIFLKHGNE